ncbi:hypothetical protein Tco_0901307 [Tanacetum coccineum]
MTKLTQKKVKFEWGDKQEAAFQLLKQKAVQCPILAFPEEAKISSQLQNASTEVFGRCVECEREKSLQHILDQKDLNMRQRRWLELLSDYDCDIRYHPGKANVVADSFKQERTRNPPIKFEPVYDY